MSANEQATAKAFRILAVDDEAPVLEVIVEILQAAGWTVDGLTNGVEAIQRIKRTRYDAMVVDLYMPDLPGLLLHSKVKFIDRELWTRTVFVSGQFSTEELRRALEGSPRFVPKPFKADVLVATVGMALPKTPRAVSAAPVADRLDDTPVRS
jgi:DNA-binding response OmpR family regulator